VLGLPTEEAALAGAVAVPSRAPSVVFDDVSYAYGNGADVLRAVSFAAAPGTVTALTGPNGAGKSTLLALLMGLDVPSGGRILLDGHPLSRLRLAEHRKRLGVVLQRSNLFDGTIEENIRYGRPRASAAEFRRAVQLARCDELVESLPRGYGTLVGERGVKLSGGQCQRVAIARAILADPRILLLDEATNQLDSEGERLVEEALGALCSGRTTFVVAHRLSTVRRADQILVLQNGAVVKRVTREELVGRSSGITSLIGRTGALEGLYAAS
jgi:ABC-type multidrug transport system fused ATPase/permease subunit